MKKYFVKVFASSLLVSAIFLSCKSTEKSEELSSPISLETSDYSVGQQEIIAADNRTTTEKIFNMGKYEKVEESSIFVKNTRGKPAQRISYNIYKPGTAYAGYLVRYDTARYAIYFTASERARLRNAITQYAKDFEDHKLDKSLKKKVIRKSYGSITGYEEFGLAEIVMNGSGRPKIDLGYEFIGASPYFCISVNSTDNFAEHINTSADKTVISQRYYFTLAQSAALKAFLEEENLAKVMAGSETSSVKVETGDIY